MDRTVSRPAAAGGPRDAAPVVPAATCPLCHTVDLVMTEAALAGGGEWCCTTCSAYWDATRLAKVAAYQGWLAARGHAVEARPQA